MDELLSVTGLTSCADTKAGGFLFKGLSGGQRRRLSLAVALVKEPSLIVLDEPTSGLDSAAAAAILTLLARIARSRRAAVVCTIHQPSALVFAGFHKVLVLSGGRVAYCGPRKEMAAHFGRVDGKCERFGHGRAMRWPRRQRKEVPTPSRRHSISSSAVFASCARRALVSIGR